MQPVFSTLRVSLAESLRRWHGTPFIQGCAKPGVGVDCVHFVREVYRDCGIDVGPAEEIPRYSLRWGIQQEHSQLLGWLLDNPEARGRLRHLDPADPVMPGDMVVIKKGRSHHHIGLIGPESPPSLWHADYPGGVVAWPWAERADYPRAVVLLRLYAPTPDTPAAP